MKSGIWSLQVSDRFRAVLDVFWIRSEASLPQLNNAKCFTPISCLFRNLRIMYSPGTQKLLLIVFNEQMNKIFLHVLFVFSATS